MAKDIRHRDIVFRHRGYTVRQWRPSDRESAAGIIKRCREEYGMNFEPHRADRDALEVEEFYQKKGRGEFWVAVDDVTGEVVGTAGYYEIEDRHEERMEEGGRKSTKSVEIRKMYLAREARGKKLGRILLEKLEEVIMLKGYREVIVKTASVLVEACHLYKSAGYHPSSGVKTKRCDCRLHKTLILP